MIDFQSDRAGPCRAVTCRAGSTLIRYSIHSNEISLLSFSRNNILYQFFKLLLYFWEFSMKVLSKTVRRSSRRKVHLLWCRSFWKKKLSAMGRRFLRRKVYLRRSEGVLEEITLIFYSFHRSSTRNVCNFKNVTISVFGFSKNYQSSTLTRLIRCCSCSEVKNLTSFIN